MEKFNQKSVEALQMLQKVMVDSGHSTCSVTAYVREIRYICAYYPELSPDFWADWYYFVKMRHYGILANANRHSRINKVLQKMNLPLHPPAVEVPYQLRLLERYGIDVDLCPKCKTGRMMLTGAMFPNNRGSPLTPSYLTVLK